MVDLHCHILPGFDDGARDFETAVEMARIAERDGIEAIVATPHTDLDKGYPQPTEVRERTEVLNKMLVRAGVEVVVFPGAEIQLTPTLLEQLRAGQVMTVADRGRHVLIELPFNTYPSFVGELFFRLQLLGVVPIIAHPERSAVSRADPEEVLAMAERGVLMQLNVDSLLGREGSAVAHVARRLLQHGAAHFIASDAHDTKSRPPRLSPARRALRRLGGDAAFTQLTVTGPEGLLLESEATESRVSGQAYPNGTHETLLPPPSPGA